MLKRSWVQALCAAVCVLALAGCGGSECESPADCRAEKGNPPAGKRYTCEENKCGLEDAPPTEVKCEPECGASEFCDTTGTTGVCRTCSATQGCASPLVCDVAANSGKGACKACTDSSPTGMDRGCTTATPVCEVSGGNGLGVCRACKDTAQGRDMDLGCSASIPMCDPAANNGVGLCKACADTASGSAMDLGCSTTAPVCDLAAANGVGACKTCQDSAQGTDQDVGCSANAPICQTTASGGRGACRSCLDSTVGSGTDQGCAASAPLCDITAGSGAGACKACIDSAAGVGTDSGCAAGAPICDPAASNGFGACRACVDSASGNATDVGCAAGAPICNPTAGNGAGACRVCVDSATGSGNDVGCAAGAPICEATASNGAGACRVCVDSAGPGSNTQDNGCFQPTAICDPTASSGAGACKVCVSTEGCPGAQTCNATGTACEGCVDDASCTNASTPYCRAAPPPSICVECVASAQCTTATRPACNTATSFCGCKDDDDCAPAAGNTDFCDSTANNRRGECKVCLTDANCAQQGDKSRPFCDNQTACIQCRTTSDCALTHVCNTNSKACEQVPGADPATTNQQIIDFNALPAVTLNPPVVIENAFVTYLKPGIGDPQAGDTAGFFLQALHNGPAMFVAADPGTLQVGDRITLTIGEKYQFPTGKSFAARNVSGITVVSSGHPVQNLHSATPAGLAVDVTTASDLVTNVEGYFGKIIRMTGTLNTAVIGAGGGHSAADAKTTGMSTGTLPRLRVPTTFANQYELVLGCAFTLDVGVMWKFTNTANPPVTTAQPSAYSLADFSALSCPTPKLVSVFAGSLTRVALTFDRTIDPASVLPTGEQFTFNNGLTASAAQVNGKQIILTTSEQTAGTSYTVTIASTVKDFLGGGVQNPGNTGTFKGYRTPAVLLLNEVQPSMPSGADLIELLVVTAGVVEGFTLQQDVNSPVLLATLPDATVAAGDIIVVHLNTPGMTNETTAKDQHPQSGTATNYDTAWDFQGGTTGITFSNRLLVIKDVVGNIQDAVPFVKKDLTTAPGAFPANLQVLQNAGLWSPADCAGNPCTYNTTPTAQDVSADWTTVPTANVTKLSNTVRRVSTNNPPVPGNKDNWLVGPQSLGAPNPAPAP
jgi:hypothetical protein